MLTTSLNPNDMAHMQRLPIAGYLTKPLTTEKFSRCSSSISVIPLVKPRRLYDLQLSVPLVFHCSTKHWQVQVLALVNPIWPERKKPQKLHLRTDVQLLRLDLEVVVRPS